ncbi:hypothetical protein BASA50_009790 [Batrachochytrium salamandrivorans]|uniref:Uncharacterized protein n=1 Tax=Batrachochytrium salamandrivorans TaxID=1357716 RepID=A0ABQ8F0C5_9FUNG|nr:hypothetical protein BASA50_009790 [Batrachochytrium salamandrivorans]
MLLSIPLISIAMLSAVVNAQYDDGDDDPDSQDDDYDLDPQYTQQAQRPTQPAHQYMQQVQNPSQPAHQYMQQAQHPSQLNIQQPLQPQQPLQALQPLQPQQPLQALQPLQPLQPLQALQPLQPLQPGPPSFQEALKISQPSFQGWQQGGGPTSQSYQQQSSYTPTLSPSDECGRISEEYGVIPFKTWGKMTESMKTIWGQRGCDQLLCPYWHKKYDVKPFESNGKMPRNIIPAWGHKQMECNFRVGPYTISQCRAASERFSTYPLGIWGSIPEYAKTLWTQGGCDVKICSAWKAKYGFSKGKTYGTMPGDIKRLWDTPGISCTDKV